MRLGILGGTFDPIHLAHLLVAETVYQGFHLDKILFIPTYRPPHKDFKQEIADEHRLKMVELAIENNPAFELSMLEFERKGISYTIQTVNHLYNSMNIEGKIHLIIGADLVADLHTWKSIEELVQKVSFVLHDRDHSKAEKLVRQYQPRYPSLVAAKDMVNMDIQSTLVRERRKEGRSIRYLVPEKVYDYIMDHELYQHQ